METVESVRAFFDAHKSEAPFVGKTLKDVQALSGGLANFVFRLELSDDSTVIAKHYPLYLAFDRTVEMSQARYFSEKAALLLVESQPWMKANMNSRIRTPRILLADDQRFVIVMEDAGRNTKPLLEHLKNDENLIKDEKFLIQIAEGIHEMSEWISEKGGITWETHGNELENASARRIIGGYVCRFAVEQAKRLNLETELAAYLKMIKPAFCTFENEDELKALVKQLDLKKVFVFGDMWPNSILVDAERRILWVIDWEMSRFGTRYQDLEQFCANLFVMLQNTTLFNAKSIEFLIKRLQLVFFGDENKDWRVESWKLGKETFVLWVLTLVRERHWQLSDQRAAILNAVKQVEQL